MFQVAEHVQVLELGDLVRVEQNGFHSQTVVVVLELAEEAPLDAPYLPLCKVELHFLVSIVCLDLDFTEQ